MNAPILSPFLQGVNQAIKQINKDITVLRSIYQDIIDYNFTISPFEGVCPI